MSRTPLSALLLLFTLLTTLSAAFSLPPAFHLTPRQQTQTPQQTPKICSEYSTIANLTVVGSNATLRAAYLFASPEGSDPARAPLDAAIPQLPSFQFNTTINDECGNLTTIAYREAEVNFTNGIVLQFKVGEVNFAASRRVNAVGMAVLGAVVVGMIL